MLPVKNGCDRSLCSPKPTFLKFYVDFPAPIHHTLTMAREFKDSLFRFIFGSAANFAKLYFWAAKKELPKNIKPYKTTKFLTSVFARML
ncbi:MAG: hypothetical protein B0D92_06920 [Spirochaeta sp. LUC14_002_19_P3]|nr:MAG: hypothetical protein B0D92_06920 [Spirochaeta sp. LUC14_002_19_P3]